jgi:hypothetical protein
MKIHGRPSLIAAFVLAATAGALAHPASAVRMEFDPPTHVLKIAVLHDSKKPAEHYIKTVVVSLNGREIVRQEFASQEDGTGQTVSYRIIDAKAGDTIDVQTVCNVFGKKKETLKL